MERRGAYLRYDPSEFRGGAVYGRRRSEAAPTAVGSDEATSN